MSNTSSRRCETYSTPTPIAVARPNGGEQLGAFDVGERGGRLVENEQPGVDRQGPGQQRHRSLDRTERRRIAPHVDRHAEALEDRADVTMQRAPPDEPAALRRAVAEHHVLGDGQPGDDGELLVLGGDTVPLGVVRIVERSASRRRR